VQRSGKTALVATAALAAALCCARATRGNRVSSADGDGGLDIRFELETAAVDVYVPDGGVRKRIPEDKSSRTAFGLALEVVDEPVRACGRTRAHPPEGAAKLEIDISPIGRVVSVEKTVTPGMEAVAVCVEEVVRNVEFPRSDRSHRIRFESRFETQR
jgi:hypothetical protein